MSGTHTRLRLTTSSALAVLLAVPVLTGALSLSPGRALAQQTESTSDSAGSDQPAADLEERLLEAMLKTYRHLETRIAESTALVEKLYEEIREAQLIRTIPGFGKYLSVLVAVEIADLSRFADAAHLHRTS